MPSASGWMQLRAGKPGHLFLASVLGLFVELSLIRWVPATLHIVGFFTNLVLIASFLGLGIGLARKAVPDAVPWQIMTRLAIAVAALSLVSILDPGVDLPASVDYAVNEVARAGGIPLPVILTAVFALVVWVTIPFGQLVAAYFDLMEPIPAYSINIAGSLTGVAAFSLLSWLSAPPAVWFALTILPLVILAPNKRNLIPALTLGAGLLALYAHDSNGFENRVHWSPYYKVIASPLVPNGTLSQGFTADVNGQFLLSGIDLRPGARLPDAAGVARQEQVRLLKSYYDLPFELRRSRKVLILGAGAGNDVAAALRHGAGEVTAVEIDPLVLDLGRRYHPERPLSAPNVHIVLDDARAFLRTSSERFDLIIYATLDAHGLLSSAGNVRLDSFVYTRESLEAAREHLAPGGIMALSFGPFREDIQLRQYSMVRSVFGQDPLYLMHANDHRTIVVGDLKGIRLQLPPEWRQLAQDEISEALRRYPHARIAATDDWPHLYVRDRRIPREYLGVFLGLLALTGAAVARNFRGAYALDGHFLFLGAGFLLLETKSVTQFALLAGATWRTNATVFSVILLVILAANLLVLKGRVPVGLPGAYVLLGAGLAASYLWPVDRWAKESGPAALLLAIAYLGVPIFLAAVIFAKTFGTAGRGSAALASNLLGAVLGGGAEYLSLAWGIRSLSLLALAMYAASFIFWWRKRRRVPAPAPAAGGAG